MVLNVNTISTLATNTRTPISSRASNILTRAPAANNGFAGSAANQLSVSAAASIGKSVLRSWTTTTALVPGENGIPACAYVLAANMGPNPVCAQDHCNCGGSIAPLLSSRFNRTWTTNCDYTTQPVTSACPEMVTVGGDILFSSPAPSTVTVQEIVNIEAVGTCSGGHSCSFTTFTALSTPQ